MTDFLWFSSRKHLCKKVTPDLQLTYSKIGEGQDKPMWFRPNPVHRCMYENCMYHMMNKIKIKTKNGGNLGSESK